jgi:hypothetical protein
MQQPCQFYAGCHIYSVMRLHKLLLVLLKIWAMMSLEQTDVMFRGVAKPTYEGYVVKQT